MALPVWVPAVGTIADVSLNTLQAASGTDSFYPTKAILNAWSGCAFAPDYGLYGSYIYTGGGGGYGSLNAVYRYDIDSRLFSKIKPSAQVFNYLAAVADRFTGWLFADVKGSALQVGEPFVGHHYAGLVATPATALPNTPNGCLLTVGRAGMPTGDILATPFAMRLRLGIDTKYMHFGAMPQHGGTGRGGACYDSLRNRLVSMADGVRYFFNVIDLNSGVTRRIFFKQPNSISAIALDAGHHVVAHDVQNDLYYAISTKTPYTLKVIHPVIGMLYNATLSNVPSTTKHGGADWVEAWGCFALYPGAGNTVWLLKRPANPLTDAWVWSSQTLTGTATAQDTNPHYSRFRYNAGTDCFLWTPQFDKPVQAFRLSKP